MMPKKNKLKPVDEAEQGILKNATVAMHFKWKTNKNVTTAQLQASVPQQQYQVGKKKVSLSVSKRKKFQAIFAFIHFF